MEAGDLTLFNKNDSIFEIGTAVKNSDFWLGASESRL
jgi:hypothetical protein